MRIRVWHIGWARPRVGSAAEQAYARSDLLERRHELMEAWVQYVTPRAGVTE